MLQTKAKQATSPPLRWGLLLLLTLSSSPALAQHGPPGLPNGRVLAPRTLTRSIDVVVARGSDLGKKLKGAPKQLMRVYACRGGFMIPITYQIDERNREGIYCYNRGPADLRVRDQDQGIDDNDELVFLAREAGGRAHPNALLMIPGFTAVQELTIRDPLDGTTAWVYVYRFRSTTVPGRVVNDLVSMKARIVDDEEGNYQWAGEGFTFNNGRSPTNAVRATHASFAQEDNTMSPNLIDCTVVKAVISFMWVTVERQSSEFKVVVGGYIDGPLRVIAQNQLQIYLALGIWVSAPDSWVILWPNRVSMPTNVTCPVNLDQSDESNYWLCLDFASKASGWKFYNSHNDEPVTIDGTWSEAERRLDMSFPDWNCMYGEEGAIISRFLIPDAVKRGDNRLVYVDDKKHRLGEPGDGLEFEPGVYGLNGFFLDMRGLKQGLYSGDYVVWYVPPPFKHGDHAPYLREYEHPLEIEATAP